MKWLKIKLRNGSLFSCEIQLHVSHQTVRRYINKFIKKPKRAPTTLSKIDILKERWLTLIKENPSNSQAQIRNQDKGLYSLLYKYDKEWLKENSPQHIPFSIGNNRVDWAERDNKYLELIKGTIEKVKNCTGKPERITIHKIEVESGLNFLSRNLDKLPKISTYINRNIESISEYRIRKAKWAIELLKNKDEEVTLPKVRKILNLYYKNQIEEIEIINELVLSYAIENSVNAKHEFSFSTGGEKNNF